MSHINDDLAAWLDARADEMAELVMRLVAIDTENPPGRGLRECGAVLRDAMARLGLAPELIELGDDACIVRGSAGAGLRGSSTSTATSTSSPPRAASSSSRGAPTAGSSAAAPPT